MAEQQPHTAFRDDAEKLSMSRMAQWAGAVVSVVLIFGMGIWVYNIVSRDVTGVPVVRAAEGPLRVQPEDPGGRPADHQGFSVNSVVSDGIVENAADQLVLAPAPLDLTDEDLPQGDLPTNTAERAETSTSFTDAETDEDLAEAAIGLADQLIAQEEENGTLAAGEDAILLAVLEATNAPDGGVGPTEAPFPKLRPDGAEANVPAASVTTSSVRELSPDAVPDGSRLVQLGAFNSAEIARSEWERMSNLFSGYLENKTRVIQRAESGGKVFYRLRAMGFEDIDDARRFCAAFKARNVDCVPVLVR
jgi:hypothetical protein